MNRVALFGVFSVFCFSSLALASIQYSVNDALTCSCDLAAMTVVAENTGDQQAAEVLHVDSVAASYPDRVDVSLLAGEKKTYTVQVQSPCGGQNTVPVTFFSPQRPDDNVTALLTGRACDGFTFRVTPEQTACQNQYAQYAVTLSNNGRADQDILLSTDLNPNVYQLQSPARLAANQTRTVLLTVNTPAVPQRLPFKVFAQGLGPVQEQPAILTVQACRGVQITGPDEVRLTAGNATQVTLFIRNEGPSRSLTVSAYCPAFVSAQNATITLNASESTTYSFTADPGFGIAPGAYACSVFVQAQDEQRPYLKTVRIVVQNPQTGGFSVQPLFGDVEQNVQSNLTFAVQNNGPDATANARIRLDGVDVLTLSQSANLSSGSKTNLTFTVRPRSLGAFAGNLVLNNQSVPFRLNVVQPTLTLDAATYRLADGTYRVDASVTNFGPATRVEIFTQPPATGAAYLDLPQNTKGTFSLSLNTTQDTLFLSLRTNRGAYDFSENLSQAQALPQTGLIAFSTPALAFGAAVLLALAILYLLFRQRKKSP